MTTGRINQVTISSMRAGVNTHSQHQVLTSIRGFPRWVFITRLLICPPQWSVFKSITVTSSFPKQIRNHPQATSNSKHLIPRSHKFQARSPCPGKDRNHCLQWRLPSTGSTSKVRNSQGGSPSSYLTNNWFSNQQAIHILLQCKLPSQMDVVWLVR